MKTNPWFPACASASLFSRSCRTMLRTVRYHKNLNWKTFPAWILASYSAWQTKKTDAFRPWWPTQNAEANTPSPHLPSWSSPVISACWWIACVGLKLGQWKPHVMMPWEEFLQHLTTIPFSQPRSFASSRRRRHLTGLQELGAPAGVALAAAAVLAVVGPVAVESSARAAATAAAALAGRVEASVCCAP